MTLANAIDGHIKWWFFFFRFETNGFGRLRNTKEFLFPKWFNGPKLKFNYILSAKFAKAKCSNGLSKFTLFG